MMKKLKGHMLYVTQITRWIACADFQLSLCISANSVGYIDTAKSLPKAESNLLADEKSHTLLGQVVVWVIHLYL